MPSIAPLRMRATIGSTNAALASTRPSNESSSENWLNRENNGTTMSASGSIWVSSSTTVTTTLARKE